MICPKCGRTVDDFSRFCENCGAELGASSNGSNPFAVGAQTESAYATNFSSVAPDIPNFFGAIKTCFSKYATFSGRASRSEYWYWILLVGPIYYFSNKLIERLVEDGVTVTALVIVALAVLWALVVLLPGLAVQVRRLHDTDRSGWWILLYLVPFVGWLILLLFNVTASTEGPNRYGLQPVKRR